MKKGRYTPLRVATTNTHAYWRPTFTWNRLTLKGTSTGGRT